MKKVLGILLCMMLLTGMFSSAMAELSPDTKSTLTMISYYSDDVAYGWIDAFNAKYPNITVEHESCADVGVLMEKLQARLMNNTAPDLYLCVAENRGFLTADGYIEDLTDSPVAALVSDAARKQIEYQGRLYAVCTGGSIGGLLVNLDLAKEAGIEKAPETWAELVEALNKLKAIDCVPFVDTCDDAAVTMLTAMYGATYVDHDPEWMNKIASGEKTHADYWKPLLELYKKDIVDSGLMTQELMGVSREKNISNFALGKIGVIMGASWDFPSIEAINPDLNFEIWGIPNVDGSSKYYFGDCLEPSFAINAQSEHKEEAYAFLESLFTAESLRSFEDINGFVACVDGYDSKFLEDPRMATAIREGMNTGSQFMPMTIWDKNVESLRQYYVSSIQSLVLGGDPVELAAGFDTVYAQ